MLIVVTGTGTEIGKTWCTARLLEALRADGVAVCARKPVQSADADDPTPSDADVLAMASGEDPFTVCPAHRRLTVAMAPPMAAEATGVAPFTIADLADEARASTPDDDAMVFVEGAGGVRSPLADDGDTATLIEVLAPDAVLLVADAALGTINAVRLTAATLPDLPVLVWLNRFDDADELHRRNRDWLLERDGFAVVTTANAAADWFRARAAGPARS